MPPSRSAQWLGQLDGFPLQSWGCPLAAPSPQGDPGPCYTIFGVEIIFGKNCIKVYCYYLALTFILHK